MNFSELNLHPTVAGALAKRGYETATPVQAAVLHPDSAGRDLLVSSQTGSGKTIAFGAALAENLLAPEAARTGNQRTNPLALVIVPTRELAVQVREELGWLLRDTKLRLASFTGGTPVTGDLRTLQKGLDIAIGTPGRLVDLLRRARLELTEIRVVVLDEADEMLDLGFREDLQTILQAAPEARRTLLLSATLPPEIQALARRFQRDALRIDPRKDGDQAARGGHGDITYVAHLIAGADRLPVVVNILRAAGEGRAIVFCTTREGVSRLHAALLARGFSATAISGDRAQAERDRALEQVRKGDARILVATNVAARGLHLPDVDLIIHADLPLNAESLTHRSGRTGRAGRKGTAVVIASLTERRKAERLMMSAQVPVVWTAPPSADSITAAARERLAEELLQEARASDGRAEDPAAEQMVKQLEEVLPARELARRLLLRELAHLPVGERVHHVPVPGPERRDRFAPAAAATGDSERGGARRPGRQDFAREGVKFRVNIGAKDNADPRWLLPLICRRGGVSSRDVGAIRVGPQETVFEISGDVVRDFELSAAERDPRAPHVTIEPLRSVAPARAERKVDRPTEKKIEPKVAAPARAEPRPNPKADLKVEAKAEAKVEARPEAKVEKKKPTPPAAVPVSAAPRTEAPARPASIFQTRTPIAAAASAAPKSLATTERSSRDAGPQPVIEMKRAPRMGDNGSGSASAQLPAVGGPTHDRRTDGTNTVKRAPAKESSAARPSTGAGQFGPARAAGPIGGGAPARGPAAGRPPGGAARPGPARAGFARPPYGAPSGSAGASGSPRPPFWKEGARKRPATPSRPGDGPRGKPPQR